MYIPVSGEGLDVVYIPVSREGLELQCIFLYPEKV